MTSRALTTGCVSSSERSHAVKARQLKGHIERIRADYAKLWRNKDVKQRQMATALYFIDILALRAGHEKDEDEADTVGCCTLKVHAPAGVCGHCCCLLEKVLLEGC